MPVDTRSAISFSSTFRWGLVRTKDRRSWIVPSCHGTPCRFAIHQSLWPSCTPSVEKWHRGFTGTATAGTSLKTSRRHTPTPRSTTEMASRWAWCMTQPSPHFVRVLAMAGKTLSAAETSIYTMGSRVMLSLVRRTTPKGGTITTPRIRTITAKPTTGKPLTVKVIARERLTKGSCLTLKSPMVGETERERGAEMVDVSEMLQHRRR
jgi:hypothetical protein